MRHGDAGTLSERRILCPPCQQGICGCCCDLFRHPRFGLVACDCDHGAGVAS